MRISARIFVIAAALLVQACSTLPPETYTPKLGQMGKDVMWLHTHDELVTQMLAAALVGPDVEGDDLGAGDGKPPIAAAWQFGARAWEGPTQTLLGTRLKDADLHFSFVQADGLLKSVKVRVQGATLQGPVIGPDGMVGIAHEVVKIAAHRLGD